MHDAPGSKFLNIQAAVGTNFNIRCTKHAIFKKTTFKLLLGRKPDTYFFKLRDKLFKLDREYLSRDKLTPEYARTIRLKEQTQDNQRKKRKSNLGRSRQNM